MGVWQVLTTCRVAVRNVLALPRAVFIILLVDFLNSYRSFGFRSVQYQYITDEFGFSDVETGTLLGVNAWLQVVFGMIGAVMVDAFGVRRTAVIALSVAVAARGLITFGRSRVTLLLAIVALTPFGEAVLSTGIYTVALKRVTTPATRGLAFGVQYGVFNLSGAIADLVADAVRKQDFVFSGIVWSGLRIHMLITWFVVIAALVVTVLLIHDVTVVELPDIHANNASWMRPLEENSPLVEIADQQDMQSRNGSTQSELSLGSVSSLSDGALTYDGNVITLTQAEIAQGYVVVSTKLRKLTSQPRNSVWGPVCTIFQESRALLATHRFWRALCCSLCLFWISKQWGDMDQLLPAFLERYYGEGVPYYTIHSINLWMCMLLPWIIASFTSHMEAFRVILPGLWIMGLSPLFLVLMPSVGAAVLWLIFLSLGEVLWSPRISAWTATLAPEGHEGVFLAILSLKNLVTSIPSTAFNGWLNDKFNPNCAQCRDNLGHFCSLQGECLDVGAHRGIHASKNISQVCGEGVAACHSISWLCVGEGFTPGLMSNSTSHSELLCPSTCQECEGWEGGSASHLWLVVLLTSLSSPILITLFLPFLRGAGCQCCGRSICSPDIEAVGDARAALYANVATLGETELKAKGASLGEETTLGLDLVNYNVLSD